MNKSHTKILIAATIVVIAVVVFFSRRDANHSSSRFEAVKLFESLNIDEVTRISLSKAGEEIVLAKQPEKGWGVGARDGYPADGQRLRRLILSVVGIKASEKLTDNPEKYARIGLGEEPEKGIVKFFGGDNKVLAELYLGKNRESKDSAAGQFAPPPRGQFIRVGNDPNVYLTTEGVSFEVDPKQWLDKELLKVKAEDLMKIQVSHAEAVDGFSISRANESDPFNLDNKLPKGKKLKSGELGTISRAISNLNLADVKKFDKKDESLSLTSTFRATAKDGMSYEIKSGQKDGKHYMRLAASYEPPTKSVEAEDQEVSETAESVFDSSLEEKAKEISSRHGDWIYEIPKYAFDGLTKKLSDLSEEEKKDDKQED